MPLIDLKTNLKGLKYGRDRQGGGSSNQPYVQSSIPEEYPIKSPDFLLRNGFLAPVNAGKDVLRLTKKLFDTKDVSGFLFIAKQNLLSRTSVKPFASSIPSPPFRGSPFINQGAYLPSSTLIQAGTGFLGNHVNHLILSEDSTYGAIMKRERDNEDFVHRNRLTSLTLLKINNEPPDSLNQHQITNIPIGNGNQNKILSYPGGPESILGFGNTNIYFADQRTGINNPQYSLTSNDRTLKTINRTEPNRIIPTTGGASAKYIEYKGLQFFNSNILFQNGFPILNQSSFTFEQSWDNKTTKSGSLEPRSDLSTYQTQVKVVDFENNNQIPISSISSITNQYISPNTLKLSNLYSGSLSKENIKFETKKEIGDINKIYDSSKVNFQNPNITDRILYENQNVAGRNNTNYTTPSNLRAKDAVGNRRADTVTNFLNSSKYRPELNNTLEFGKNNIKEIIYSSGDPGSKVAKSNIFSNPLEYRFSINKKYALDQLAALDVGEFEIDEGQEAKDIVNFRIQVIGGEILIFRAFLESFNDNYTSNWNPVKYVGRGENFYSYEGFNREISLAFNVYAQSKGELRSMYNKLNYLASITAPSYSSAGFMRGNIIQITVGNYIVEQPGLLKQLNYEINLEASWDTDEYIQMPHMIKVGTFSFTPVHNFVPRLSENEKYLGNGKNFRNYDDSKLTSDYKNKYYNPSPPSAVFT